MMQTHETPYTQYNAPIDSQRNLWERFSIAFGGERGPKSVAKFSFEENKILAAIIYFFAARVFFLAAENFEATALVFAQTYNACIRRSPF